MEDRNRIIIIIKKMHAMMSHHQQMETHQTQKRVCALIIMGGEVN